MELWGAERIDPEWFQNPQAEPPREPHRWIRRGIYHSCRDLEEALKADDVYLYTGRCSSSSSNGSRIIWVANL